MKKGMICVGALFSGLSVSKVYEDYSLNMEIKKQRLHFESSGRSYSGILVCERPSLFHPLWIFNHLIPWHVYLEIPMSDGSKRLVGLGQPLDAQSKKEYKRRTTWRNHQGPLSEHFNLRKTPLELWIPFWKRYPHARAPVDTSTINKINKFTTFGAACPNFLSFHMDLDQETWIPWNMYTCRTAVFLVLKDAMDMEDTEGAHRVQGMRTEISLEHLLF